MSALERVLDGLAWEPIPKPEAADSTPEIPYVTHQGVINLGDVALKVYQLSSGQRIIDSRDLDALFAAWDVEAGEHFEGGGE